MIKEVISNSNKLAFLLLIFSLAFLLWWSCPGIPKGTDNINVINHFNFDEGGTINFFEKFYKGIFICPPATVGYPTAFYYIAGIYLFPYSALNLTQDNHQAVIIAIRALNTLSTALTIILIFLLARYLLGPGIFPGALLLFIVFSPNCLWWSFSYRPHPFEILLLLASLFCGLIWIEKMNNKYLYWCLFLAAFAFGVKYGGMFIIPAVLLFLIGYLFKINKEELRKLAQKLFPSMLFFATFLVIASMGLIVSFYHFFIPLAVKITYTGARLGVQGLTNLKLFKLSVFFLWFMALVGFLWLSTVIWSKRYLNAHKEGQRFIAPFERLILLSNISLLALLSIAALFATIFAITNPHLIFHPISSARAFFGLALIEFSFSSQGDGFLKELFKNFAWFKMLFDKGVLGISGAIGLVWYFIVEFYDFKVHPDNKNKKLPQRIFIWLLILANLFFLVFFIKFRTHHYLLLISYLLFLLIIYGVDRSFQLANNKAKPFLLLLFCAILALSLIERVPIVFRLRWERMDANADTGLKIGRWFEEKFEADVKIWKDTFEFYVPQKFKRVFFMDGSENINQKFPEIRRIGPDVLVITNRFDPSLGNFKAVNQAIEAGLLKNYKMIKSFKYDEGPLAKGSHEFGRYQEIFIYTR